jgi:hypothetical protein
MLAPSGPLNEIDLHVEVRGDLLIVTSAATQFYAIYAKPSQPQLILRSPSLAVTSFSDALGKLQTRRRTN